MRLKIYQRRYWCHKNKLPRSWPTSSLKTSDFIKNSKMRNLHLVLNVWSPKRNS